MAFVLSLTFSRDLGLILEVEGPDFRSRRWIKPEAHLAVSRVWFLFAFRAFSAAQTSGTGDIGRQFHVPNGRIPEHPAQCLALQHKDSGAVLIYVRFMPFTQESKFRHQG